LLDLKTLALSEVIRQGTPKRYMMCRFRKLMTLSDFTSLNGIASAHLEKKSVAARIKWCPLADGGSMAPITSIPQASIPQASIPQAIYLKICACWFYYRHVLVLYFS
jgi:hypothetical protein